MKSCLKKKIRIYDFEFSFQELAIFILLIFIFFASRLINLTGLPIFADEAIYIRWSQVMRAEETLRFLPLSDGKQPFFMWLVIPFLKILKDPLAAGRFVSVLSGFLTMLGLGSLVYYLKRSVKHSMGIMALYIIIPYTLFFDRMALVDSLLSAFGVWGLLFALLLGEYRRLDLAMILGLILAGGWLTKSPGLFLVLLSPLAVFGSYYQKRKTFIHKEASRLAILSAVSVFFAFVGYNILRLGPNFHLIALRNKDYVWPLKEILKHPFNPLIPHLKDVWRYYTAYLTIPLFALGFLGIYRGLAKKDLRFYSLVFLSWWLLPLFIQSAAAKVFTARYLLYGVPAFLLFIFLGLEFTKDIFKNKRVFYFFVFFLSFPALFFNYRLWTNAVKAPLPKDEYRGYLEDWTAGWGIKEVAQYLKTISREKGIVVGTEGYFGTLPDGLQIYLEKEADISVIGVGFPLETLPESLTNAQEYGNQVYLVINKSRLGYPRVEDWELIGQYSKPGGDELLFYKL
ncbi:MAG: hypothetical protein ABIB61_02145 [Candidatus Shapirobacteria bacterium]